MASQANISQWDILSKHYTTKKQDKFFDLFLIAITFMIFHLIFLILLHPIPIKTVSYSGSRDLKQIIHMKNMRRDYGGWVDGAHLILFLFTFAFWKNQILGRN